MSEPRDDNPDGSGSRADERPAEDEADFADEHAHATFADDMPGGPEREPEPESPTGRGGDGGMDPP